jgi:hypothetical protein
MKLLAVVMCVLAVCCGVLGAPQRPPYQPDPWVYPKPTSEPPLPVTPSQSWPQRPHKPLVSNVTPPRLGTSQRPKPVAASLTTVAGSTKKPPAALATTAASISVVSSTQSPATTTPAAAEAPEPAVTQEMPQPEAAATKVPSQDF